MLSPKRVKWRKSHKGWLDGMTTRGHQISFGSYGLKAIDPGFLSSRQIEAARIAMTRRLKREGKVWIRIFPDRPITQKPAEVRMGKGKGGLEYWAAAVHAGTIMFECDGVSVEDAREAMHLAAQKLPIKTKFIIRRDI